MTHAFSAIVIGASAGAVEALSQLLPTLPADYHIPILIVVHMPPDKKSVMAEVFQHKCALPVREAEAGEPIEGGTIYFAPPDYHLLVEKHFHLSLSSEEQVHFSRPSIDILFETAADAYGVGLLGIVLTGANQDGAKGLKAIGDAGGTAIIQQPACAYASAMPKAALALCPHAGVLNISDIALYMKNAPYKEEP